MEILKNTVLFDHLVSYNKFDNQYSFKKLHIIVFFKIAIFGWYWLPYQKNIDCLITFFEWKMKNEWKMDKKFKEWNSKNDV